MRTFTKPQCDRIAVAFLAIFTIFRVWYSGLHELTEDESYYWQWSRHLAAGYYDNTPLMAYVIHFFTHFFGTSEITVRLGAVLSALVASAFIYLLARRTTSPQAALVAVIAANIIPLFAAGAVLMTQDPVQLALWSAAAYVVWLAVEPDEHRSDAARFGFWIVGGVLAGLTTMAKLNGIMILPAVLFFVALEPTQRRWLKSPAPYLAVLVSVAITIPFFHWDATHHHAFTLHAHTMANRVYDHNNWPGRALIEYLGAQLALLSPGFFVIYLVTLWRYRPGTPDNGTGRKYLWCLTVLPLAIVAFVAMRHRVEANWSVAGYIGAMILAGEWVWTKIESRKGSTAIAVSFGLAALMSGFLLAFPLVCGKVQKNINELYGWHQMASRIEVEQRAMGPSFVFGVNYRMPSEAAFYLPRRPVTYSLFLKDRANEYMFWGDPVRLIGQNAVLVNDTDDSKPSETDDTLAAAKAVFARVDKQPSLKVTSGGLTKPLRVIQIYRCYGFKGYDPAKWQNGW